MHYLAKNNYKFLIIASFLFTILINLIDYLDLIKPDTNDYSLIYRGIDSNFRFFFFGVFGIFFNLKISCFSFLLISIVVFYFLNFIKLSRKNQIFVFSLILISSVIMSKGFFNYRYSTTLLPLIIFVILYEYNEAYPKFFSKRYVFFLVLSVLTIGLLAIAFYFLTTNTLTKAGNKYNTKTEWIQIGLPRYLNSQFLENKKITSFYSKVDSILLHTKKGILINNIPEYYLKCKSKGIYYWCGDDIIYQGNKTSKLFSLNNAEIKNENILKHLNNLNVGFILSFQEYNNYSPQFKNFILSSTQNILEEDGLILYKVSTDKFR